MGKKLHCIPGAIAVLGRGAGKIAPSGNQKGQRLHFQLRQFDHCCSGSALLQTPALHKLMHFQISQQLCGRSRVTLFAEVVLRVCVNGGVPADGTQHMGELSILPVSQQVLPLFRFDRLVFNVGVDIFQTAEFLDKGERRLFPDAFDTGNVVGGIPHQALDLNELGRLDAVFLADGILVHGEGFLVGSQKNGCGAVHQLQAVPVAGCQQCSAACLFTGSGESAQDVVCFPAGLADLNKPQVGQQFFQYRHLLGQFLGHAVAGGLVSVVGSMAEGGGFFIPRNGNGIRLLGRQQIQQNILEAVNGIGITAVLCGKHLDAEKCPVHQAVAV